MTTTELIEEAKRHYKKYDFPKLDRGAWPDTMRNLVRALKAANVDVDDSADREEGWAERTRVAESESDTTRAVIAKVRALYKKRCTETIHEFTPGEELFLADLSAILNPNAEGPTRA